MRRQRLRWLTLFVAFGLVVAACGGDDDDESGGGDTEEADFEAVAIDESAQCGTEEYAGNLAGIEAVDELTVRFTLCNPDVAFPAKVAFSALGIFSAEQLEETGGAPIDAPIGTGPYKLEAWERGSQIVLTANEDYWGDAPAVPTVVFRWSAESAQRLVELQSGSVDGIDNVGTEDFPTVADDASLQLLERDPLNVFYLGFNVDKPPFDNEMLRQAIGYAIDRDRLIENFYPEGSQVADQFLPPGINMYEEGAEGFTYDPDRARDLLAQAGFADGVDLGALSYRAEPRPYLPQPPQVASDIRDQLAQVGITVTLDEQESGAFIDNANTGNLSMYMLGWGADFPDATNFWDFHFGEGASPQFGTGFPDLHEVLADAGSTTDEDERAELYAEANGLLFQHAQALPIAYGGSAVAFKAEVEGAHASPLSNEQFSAMSLEGADQLVWMQNGEPSGLYCADETDGEALRVCEQINESLLAYEVGGTEVVPSLAEDYESNDDLTEWTFTLREGVTFHDGSALDAGDVVESYRIQWDAADPLHVGRDGLFTYFEALFGGFLNPPPPEEG
ncbi:MAG TPA: ABC transporter substrate-binding protein [Acidimicrobiales bacterium]|nr:ABC transporter substrate-binding protein [Acidimicrobiales bacterium]